MAKMQFQREQVLEQSANLFWRVGYHATSMQQVFQHTGLKPGSVYLAFGNKEALFKESLTHYCQASLQGIQASLSAASNIELGICQILESMLVQSLNSDYCSCFLVKSQLEFSDEPELQALVSEQLQQIEALYSEFLMQIYDEPEAKAKACSLMLHIFGIRVYSYHQGSLEKMRQALQVGLPWLPWPNTQH
ncbi:MULTISPECIES: TetR/AcrR family transcriptional regulator [unclassified Agarivorans]|uniref:TetR/AcrR family transcriptional regulator n=1 Tax=unclassified Agarivorans TaxID=2636026 RepID=UPI0026E1EA5E|nr:MULTISPECIES: TetR/AcrR family transcriptional regulator [unclassified Agarivorans]MDO6683995.1 TetR/AcrR family transcriptional regulator [Agarivorans sp. 3_MG-2023]MDO6714272.1 TetR/AcrR family transcriptional regulator [Agarivorans sp. 2_MG-2023]